MIQGKGLGVRYLFEQQCQLEEVHSSFVLDLIYSKNKNEVTQD
jgi:hypothetical protein